MTLRVSGLFAGIGGFEEGLRRAGHATVQLCESDPAACSVLERHFPNLEIARDVRTLDRLVQCDAVVAGFPCQDLSQVGRTRGLRGKSSGLVREVFRLINATKPRPTWLVLENVHFMLKLKRGLAMRQLTAVLDDMGWRWAYRTVDSRAFGLAQRRRRVIVVASRHEDPRNVLFADDNPNWVDNLPDRANAYGFYWTEGNTGIGWAVDAIPTLKGGSAFAIPSPPAIWKPGDALFGTPSIEDAERLQGFARGWTSAAKRLKNGERQRWRLIGNAVSLPVARWVGRRLERPGDVACEILKKPFDDNAGWPEAGWGRKGKRFEVLASEGPVKRDLGSLSSILRDELRPLSYRASAGFCERLEKSDLRTGSQFRSQLKMYVARKEKTDRKARR